MKLGLVPVRAEVAVVAIEPFVLLCCPLVTCLFVLLCSLSLVGPIRLQLIHTGVLLLIVAGVGVRDLENGFLVELV